MRATPKFTRKFEGMTQLSTGIPLRDGHTKKALEVETYRDATLTVARGAVKFPGEGDVRGTLKLHGQTKPVTLHYATKVDRGTVSTTGNFTVGMSDFLIKPPSYLGVTAKNDVTINASFKVTGP